MTRLLRTIYKELHNNRNSNTLLTPNRQFSAALKRHCTVQLPHRIALIMYAETCSALVNLPAICAAAAELARTDSSCLFEPAGLVFGSDDFCASLGATRTADALEVLYARQRVVLVAKAFGLQVG